MVPRRVCGRVNAREGVSSSSSRLLYEPVFQAAQSILDEALIVDLERVIAVIAKETRRA
jgi:hypothetical protein